MQLSWAVNKPPWESITCHTTDFDRKSDPAFEAVCKYLFVNVACIEPFKSIFVMCISKCTYIMSR